MGPDSFSIGNDGNVVIQQPTSYSAGPAIQLTGGGANPVAPAQVVQGPNNDYRGIEATGAKTLEAINNLTQGMLKPYIEAEQKRMYFEGMSKVAQGKSLVDIEKEQPWFTKIFGPSATVQGAQAMTASTALTQAHTEFLQAMPDLRQKSPDEVRKYLVDQAANIGTTGDPMVDAMVQAKLADSWGPMLNTHMKEHIAWQQEDMLKKQVNLNISNGENLKFSRLANKTTGWDSEEKAKAYGDVVEAARPAYGQSVESWSKGMTESIRANLTAGNFDYYNAIRSSDLWGQLDPAARTQLEAQVPLYVQKDALTNPDTAKLLINRDGLEFNLTHGTSGMTHKQLDAVLDGFNGSNTQTTGAPSALIDNDKRAYYHKLLDAGDLLMGKQLAAATAKQASYNDAMTVVAKAFNSGNFASLKGLQIPEKAAVDFMDASFSTEVGSADPKRMQVWFDKAAQVSSEGKLRSPQLEGIFQTQLGPLITGNGPATPSMQQALSYASLLYHSPAGGAGALANYLGADQAAKVIGLLQSGADINDPKQLDQAREVITRGAGAVVSKVDKDAAKAVISKADPSWWKRMIPFMGAGELTPFSINDGNKQALTDLIAPQIARYSKAYHMPVNDAAPLVLADVMRNADMLPGAFVLHNPSVRGDASFAGAVNRIAPGLGNQHTALYQQTMKEFINERLTAAVAKSGGDMENFDPNDYEVRSGEQLGNGQLLLFMSSKKHAGLQMVKIDAGRDDKDENGFVYRLLKNKGKPVKSDSGFGPDNTFLTEDRTAKSTAAYLAGWDK